jgi:hypothetical protein
MMGGLLSIGLPSIDIDFPNETSTGADMRWDFVNRSTGAFFSLFVQAKKLYDHGANWQDHAYDHLDAITGVTGIHQAKVLCDHARAQNASYPLYAFYNQGQSCDLARAAGVSNVDGVSLASGYVIEKGIVGALDAATRGANKRLGALQPKMFSLSELFCPSRFAPFSIMNYWIGPRGFFPPLTFQVTDGRQQLGFELPPRPEDIRQRLVEALQRVAEDKLDAMELPEVPSVASSIPNEVLARIRRRSEGETVDEAPKPYWTITVVSADPRAE